MSSKILNAVLFCLLSLCFMGKANATLIVGDQYEDSVQSGLYWEYVGSYNLADQIDSSAKTYNGIEAALLFFPGLSADDIALSTNNESSSVFLVNHQAFYDTFNGGSIGVTGVVEALEDIAPTDANGNSYYDSIGDISANVYDRFNSTEDFERAKTLYGIELPVYITHVFKSVTTSVPEPSTLAIFALALVGLASRRIKR